MKKAVKRLVTTLTLLVTMGASPFIQAQPILFEAQDLIDLAKNNPKIRSIEDLVPLLPASLRSDFTLIKDSDSLQGTSPLHPRVLMMNPSRNMFVTFNGDLNERGSEAIEIAAYNETRSRIEFFEIDFPANHNAANAKTHIKLAENDIAYRDQRVTISKPNPAKCMLCHSIEQDWALKPQADRIARYIWHPYDQWPKNFGSFDDYAFMNESDYEPQVRDEVQELRDFQAAALLNDRYKHLLFGKSKNAPFCDEQNFANYNSKVSYDVHCRKNQNVSRAIGQNQMSQLAQILVDRYGEKSAINYLNKVLGCGNKIEIENLEFMGRRLSNLDEIFKEVNTYTDPAVNLKNVSRPIPKVWNMASVLHLKVDVEPISAAEGATGTLPVAVIRELAKKNPKIATAYRQAVEIANPTGYRGKFKVLYKDASPDDYARTKAFLAVADDAYDSGLSLDINTGLCRALAE